MWDLGESAHFEVSGEVHPRVCSSFLRRCIVKLLNWMLELWSSLSMPHPWSGSPTQWEGRGTWLAWIRRHLSQGTFCPYTVLFSPRTHFVLTVASSPETFKAHIYHNRHNRQWCTFFKPVYFLAPSGALIAIPTYYWYSTHPLFQITPVLNTGLSLSEPLQLYKKLHFWNF